MGDFVTTWDYSRKELETILELASELKKSYYLDEQLDLFDRQTLFMLFYNPSLRTRNSFEAGMTQLGGHAHFLDASTSYIPVPGDTTPVLEGGESRERLKDSARVLDTYGDMIAIRAFGDAVDWEYGKGHEMMRGFAEHADNPVINMEDNMFHPCQSMADMLTLKEEFGLRHLQDKKVVLSWAPAPNPWKPVGVPQSFLRMTEFGMDVTVATPPEFELDDEYVGKAREMADEQGSEFVQTNDVEEAYEGADVVYAKNWTSLDFIPPNTDEPKMDKVKEIQEQYVGEWTCDAELMDRTDDANYMHCLPADVGEDLEVTPEVIDSDGSLTIDQAENRMHAQKGIMAYLGGNLP